jgi:uncharacterized membrane protein
MDNLPFHPLIVHFPLALAALVPVAALCCLVLSWRRAGRGRLWRFVSVVLAIIVATGILAMKSGEAEEETVESFVAEASVETHEERAELFVWASATALGFSIAVPPVSGERRWRRAVGLAALLATVLAAGLAVRVGHSGGELVYVHGAAVAYRGSIPAPNHLNQPLLEHSDSSATDDPRDWADDLQAELVRPPADPER